jgi:EamA domain-containing membrane protein RarD
MTGPVPTPPRAYLAGCGLVVLAGLVLSLGVICIRGASASDAWQYLLWLRLPLMPGPGNVALGLLHGGVVLALELVLFARGSRAVPAVTLVLLAQRETVTAPLWAYLVFGETTTLAVVAGAAAILAGVVLQAADGARRRAPSATAPSPGVLSDRA